jgi:sigma-B regulation protein RsbU (phosphoserine phosphatase)
MMPGLDGEEVLRRLKADAATRDISVVMLSAADDASRVARSIDSGADDFLPKPFDPVLLRARVGACLERKSLRDREREAHRAFVASQKELAIQLADAADYVESLLPAPLAGPVSIDWRFIPSTSLGGDVFGYHWVDDDHLAIYLLDVCGHGVSTALLSVSAVNVLRSHALPDVDFRAPAQVLAGLNTAFSMEKQNGLYFTIWYGVYERSTRRLSYATGGHPPAVLVAPGADARSEPDLLQTIGTPIGVLPDVPYQMELRTVVPGSRLFVFSDGACEIEQQSGGMWEFDDFARHLAQPSRAGESDLDRLVNFARNLHGRPDFEDDLSVMRLSFD